MADHHDVERQAIMDEGDVPHEKRDRKRRPKHNGNGAVHCIGFRLTDLGNAERFVARFTGSVLYCPPRKAWLTWDGRRWAWDETGRTVRLAKETVREIYNEASKSADADRRQAIARHAAKSESAARIAAMLDLARSEAGIPVMPRELDADPWLLNVQNGTIDLKTGELREHRREDFITKLAPVNFDPEADHELWCRCINDATGDDAELAAYLQRICGYSLVGAAPEKCFFFFHGPANTAKSTVVGAWVYALGDYAQSAAFDTWLARRDIGGNRGDLVRLMGVRLVSSVETKRGGRFDEGLIKLVTGGDEIVAAAKYEAEVTFLCTFALVLAANDAPKIRDDDDAMWARVQRVPFTHVIPEPDPKFREQLKTPEVAAAVLAWAVAGCLAWQLDGLSPPACVQESTDAYRRENDRFAGFVEAALVIDPKGSITTKRLKEIYEQWCDDEDVHRNGRLSAKERADRLRTLGADEGKSNGQRVWWGIRESDMYDRTGTRGT